MFDRMDLGSVHNRLKVRTGHTDIEGRNMAVSGDIPAGNVNAGNQFQMIDSEACDLFHLTVSAFIIKGIPCGYKIEFVNCQYLFSRSAPFNCQFILVSHSDLYYNNV